MSVLTSFLLLLAVPGGFAASSPISSVTPAQWQQLNTSVEGRLFPGVPFESPCFEDFNSDACASVKAAYSLELLRSNVSSAYINTQWETCQVTGEQCLLDWTDIQNAAAIQSNFQCKLGSVSSYFIDVRTPNDVAVAFKFSRATKVPLVIKNTGHDYKGRSSAPNSLALWTHNLKTISYNPAFVPEGCTIATPGVTFGAGVQWGEAYAFADVNNITVVGGTDMSVGTSGGWLQGGGHGALANTLGLGVDRVLQIKVITPDGEYRIANACQNQDLFFALRGGGGGTFGVVLESTTTASPRFPVQVAIVSFPADATLNKQLWTVLVDNGIKWANEGWGGFSNANAAVYVSPNLSPSEAAASMAPLLDFGKQLQSNDVSSVTIVMQEYPSWWSFYGDFGKTNVASVGKNLAIASRLIPKANFNTEASRAGLVNALIATQTSAPGVLILFSPPVTAPVPPHGTVSVTEAWRDSIYHVTFTSSWTYNATTSEKKGNYTHASDAASYLRKITPDAAYSNEADVYEPNHEVAFWGTNYPKLLEIKQKYDPERLLDCWNCVGWNPKSPRFSCYL